MLKYKLEKIKILVVLILFLSHLSHGQTVIKLTKTNGIYTVPCQINGKTGIFYFDTGASDISISLGFFKNGIKEGFLKVSDMLPEIVNYQVANGDIHSGRHINIKQFKIGNLTLSNIIATIVDNEDAPLLLGQSALEKFGSYTINSNTSTLTIAGNEKSDIDKALKTLIKIKGIPVTPVVKDQIAQAKIDILNDTKIASDLQFEVFKITKNENGEIRFEYDITNTSTKNYKPKPLSFITVFIDIYTEDGKTYSTSSMIGEILSSKTINGDELNINIRNKTPKYYRIYGAVNSPYLSSIEN